MYTASSVGSVKQGLLRYGVCMCVCVFVCVCVCITCFVLYNMLLCMICQHDDMLSIQPGEVPHTCNTETNLLFSESVSSLPP